LIVFERPPMYHNVTVTPLKRHQTTSSKAKSLTQTFNLPIPWQVYVAEYHSNGALASLKMYFSDSEIINVDQNLNVITITNKLSSHLHIPTLPNIYDDHHFCIDERVENVQGNTVESKILGAYNAVWDTVFNFDLIDIYNSGVQFSAQMFKDRSLTDEFRFFQKWESMSIMEVVHDKRLHRAIGNQVGMNQVDISNFYESSFVSFANIIPRLV